MLNGNTDGMLQVMPHQLSTFYNFCKICTIDHRPYSRAGKVQQHLQHGNN